MPERNYSTGTIWTRDCIEVMRGMNSETVDLIYLDPPFNSKQDYAAPIGSQAAGAAFKDTWSLSDIDAEWIDLIERRNPALQRVLLAAMTDSDKSYLAYMAARLLEIPRLLTPTGSIYLHCDPTMSHYLKLVMDAIFGRQHFRNEIIWSYRRWTGKAKRFQRLHDVILFYSLSDQHTFNVQYDAYTPKSLARKQNHHTRVKGDDVYITSIDERGVRAGDVWPIQLLNSQAAERVGYPTQKPLALLERIIKASSNPGDMVLDPFCGCATTCIAAENLGRQWIGIDLSPKAGELVLQRLGAGDQAVRRSDVILRDDIPPRTDMGDIPRHNSAANRAALYGQQAGHCAGCGTHFELRNLEVDHIIARARGGTDHIDNLQLLCGNCNRIKGDRGMAYLSGRLQLSAAAS